MTKTKRNAVTTILVTWIVLPLMLAGPVAAERDDRDGRDRYGDVVHVFTSDIVIPEGTVRHGSVVSIGGDVRIEGKVTGDAIVILGSVTVDGGEVRQSLIGVLTQIDLRDAEIRGDLLNIAGGLSRENEYVGGELFDLGLIGGWFPGVIALLTWARVLGLLIAFVVLVLLVAIAPERVRLIKEETAPRYLAALFVGLLVYVVLWTLVFPLVLGTLIGLPFLGLAWTALKWLGIAGVFFSLGSAVGRGLGREMSPMGAVLLVFGFHAAILLVLSPFGLVGLILIGLYRTVFFVFVEAPAVGLILLTRFGTRSSSRTVETTTDGSGATEPPRPPAPPLPTRSPLDAAGPRDPSGERLD